MREVSRDALSNKLDRQFLLCALPLASTLLSGTTSPLRKEAESRAKPFARRAKYEAGQTTIPVKKLDPGERDEIMLINSETNETLVYKKNLVMTWRSTRSSPTTISLAGYRAKANIEERVFLSDFTAKELQLLDLKANSKEMINMVGDIKLYRESY